MSITSFFKSLFGAPQQQAPIITQAVTKPRAKSKSKSPKAIKKTRTKAKRRNQSHPWLAKEANRIDSVMATRIGPFTTYIAAPQYMDLERARNLVLDRLTRHYGRGNVSSHIVRDDHSIQVTVTK